MTTVSGCAATICFVASMPFIFGMLMSISTSAGCSRSTNSIASSPLDASPASSNPSSRRNTARAAIRNGDWSSTTSTERKLVIKEVLHVLAPRPRVLASASAGGSASLRLVLTQVDKNRLHPAIHIAFFTQAEFCEDRIRVLFHGSLGHEQRCSDGGIALTLRHLSKDLQLSRRQGSEPGLIVLRL